VKTTLLRQKILAEKIVIVDGIPGCGKTRVGVNRVAITLLNNTFSEIFKNYEA
jgi:DNA helicase IV